MNACLADAGGLPFWANISIDPYLLVIGMLVMFGFFLFRLQRRATRSGESSPLIRVPRPNSSDGGGSAGQRPAELGRWEVEMHELTRAWSARLDTKLSALQQLIIVADQRLARLDEQLAELNRRLQTLPHGSDKPQSAKD